MTAFSQALRDALTHQGMSQAQLAERVGVTRRAVSYWTNGHKEPLVSMAARIAVALGVTLDSLAVPSGMGTSVRPSTEDCPGTAVNGPGRGTGEQAPMHDHRTDGTSVPSSEDRRECGEPSPDGDGKVCRRLCAPGFDYHGGGHWFADPDLDGDEVLRSTAHWLVTGRSLPVRRVVPDA